MTPVEIYRAACAEGVVVTLSAAGTIKAAGEQSAVNRWRPALAEHKIEIIKLLAGHPGGPAATTRPALSNWCRNDCLSLEAIDLPGEGPVPGCLRPGPGVEQWTRLDWLRSCPRRSGGRVQR